MSSTDWREIAPGVSQRVLAAGEPFNETLVPVYILRVDPALATFRIAYDPLSPRTIGQWQDTLEAEIVLNGGFFTPEYQPVGWLVLEGNLQGVSLASPEWIGFAGLLGISGEQVGIYPQVGAHYDPRTEAYDYAVEAYPILVNGGKPVLASDSGQQARRTVAGLDRDGQVLFLVVDSPTFALADLAQWLAHSELGLVTALNLDGGGSSGVAVNLPGERRVIESYVPLPIVIEISLQE